MSSPRARRSRPVGLRAEAAAEAFLVEQGYRPLARNHYSREGEVDLIVAREQLVVFVEVKARRPNALVDPLTSVTPAKQRKIVRAALAFLRDEALGERALRFDVVAVTLPRRGGPATPAIQHLEGAFDASMGDDRGGGW